MNQSHNPKSLRFTKFLLSRSPPEKISPLLDHLPEEERNREKEITLNFCPPSISFLFPSTLLQKIHYSWLASPLQKSSILYRKMCLSSLPATQGEPLAALLQLPTPRAPLPAPLREFVLNDLKKKVIPDSILPEELLPATDANSLLALTKNHLIKLIDLLGIFDLSTEVKQTVDKRLIEKIGGALNEEEIKVLQFAKSQQTKGTPSRFDLHLWDGSRKHLFALLHKKGLERLAKAIADQEPSFIWNLVHKMDEGRGSAILQYLKTNQEAHLASYFRKQATQLIQRASL